MRKKFKQRKEKKRKEEEERINKRVNSYERQQYFVMTIKDKNGK